MNSGNRIVAGTSSRRGASIGYKLVVMSLAMHAVFAEAADSLPPTLRVRRVNDVDAASLAAVREKARNEVWSCRKMMNMPDAPPPELPDAQLAKIVFFDEVGLYQPQAAATYSIERSVHADDQSKCEPFVWATRTATVLSDCDARISGHGVMIPGTLMPGLAGRLPPAETVARPRSPGCTVPARQAWNTAGATPTEAGNGVPCVWLSAVMKDSLGPGWNSTRQQAGAPPSDGRNPAPSGDQCVLAKWPLYSSPYFKPTPLVLKAVAPHKGHVLGTKTGGDLGDAWLYANSHLVEFQEGGTLPDSQFTQDAVSTFVKQNSREALPAAR